MDSDRDEDKNLSFSYYNTKKTKVRTESNCFNDGTNKRISISPANANLILQYISNYI